MLSMDLMIQDLKLGRVEIGRLANRRGLVKHIYEVRYETKDGFKMLFEVRHKRDEGVAKLLKIVFSRLSNKIDKMFEIPKDKIVDGYGIFREDVPEAVWTELQRRQDINSVVTCSTIDGKNLMYLCDVEGWIRQIKSGIKPVFD